MILFKNQPANLPHSQHSDVLPLLDFLYSGWANQNYIFFTNLMIQISLGFQSNKLTESFLLDPMLIFESLYKNTAQMNSVSNKYDAETLQTLNRGKRQ